MSDGRPDLTRLSIDRSVRAAPGGRGGWVVALLMLLLFGAYAAWKEGWLGGLDPRPAVAVGNVRRSGGVVERAAGTSANGYVVARRQAALSTEIQGRIVELRVEEGDRVEAGELVARLDTRELEAGRKRVQADIERTIATLELAQENLDRQEALLPTGDTSVAERDTALTARDEAEAALLSLRAALEEVDVRIANSSVVAPFAGIITAKNAEVGEVVSALGATGPNARGAVATLVDFDTLEVQVELSQTSLGVARTGSPVSIYLDAFPTDAYRGRVRQIWPMADRNKATVEVRVEFLERDDRILPELGVRVVFLDEERVAQDDEDEPAVFAPVAALSGGDDPFVFLLQGDRVVRRAVRTDGDPVAGEVKVTEGLVGNERVVLDPDPTLEDGDVVRVEERT